MRHLQQANNILSQIIEGVYIQPHYTFVNGVPPEGHNSTSNHFRKTFTALYMNQRSHIHREEQTF